MKSQLSFQAITVVSSLMLLFTPTVRSALAEESQAIAPRPSRLPANEQKSALSLPRLVLKNGKFMLVVDPDGMLPAGGLAGYGLYADDTRFLSDMTYTINGVFPTLLQSSVDEGFAGRFLYGNRTSGTLKEQSVLLDRQLVLRDGLVERVTVHNYSVENQDVTVAVHVYSDFDDMFEVRGQKRAQHGKLLPVKALETDGAICGERISYEGLDHNVMGLDVKVSGQPVRRLDDLSLLVELHLPANSEKSFEISFQPQMNDKYLSDEGRAASQYANEIRAAREEFLQWRNQCASIKTENERLNEIIERTWRDLYILRQPTPKGYCIAAGIPWYATAFGRDQLIVGMQTLPFNQQISKEVLQVLANYQGKTEDPATEESPGKIMHELRLGEMARCRETPFIPYYGTVDATPLWMMLLSQYVEWTDDQLFLEQMWPNAERALQYLDNEVQSGSGYLRYGLKGNVALGNQGWKDSGDAISHKDGTLATKPIALCEVQGYLYEAWTGGAKLARRLKKEALANDLDERAEKLRVRFQRDFWMPEENFVAMALDGANRQCGAISSNPGQLLGTAVLSSDQKQLVSDRLAQPDIFCGWGLRTLSAKEKRFNPMSYHNGTVWPHDNAITVAGMSKVKGKTAINEIVTGLFSVAGMTQDRRLPELFCGFSREQFAKPVDYPVSCSPQAWAAGSVLQMISAVLHISADVNQHCDSAPQQFGKVVVSGLRVHGQQVNLTFERPH
jgi:glycogen debranching enzyme